MRTLDDAFCFFAVARQPHGLLLRLPVRSIFLPLAEPSARIGGPCLAPDGTKTRLNFQIVLRHELPDGEFPLDKHGQGRSLHTSHGEILAMGKRVCTR